ncbi:MAG: TraR/DksA C4-type zinc finger protein [Candidatus Pacebacteria bacterium]|nr:TraR/DksA C4-type zinc finger protein [Candidatus Paceibacterota bacterium]MCF7857332.1 TraR/DksA C4-type zinc finger protein [Candidatus Paceibacterota bacterium]
MEIDIYKVRLEQMKTELAEELKSIGIHNPDNPQDWIAVPEELDAEEPDANLAADAVEEWNERRALIATLEPRYNNIVAALARIDTKTFGLCETCENPIEEARLDANPSARTCIAHLNDTHTI